MGMTRGEHLTWCKERALALVESGDLDGAYTSMMSDLTKHEETIEHPIISLSMMLKMSGHLSSKEKMREFIEDFG